MSAESVGFWRFDDAGAGEGMSVGGTVNSSNPGTHDAVPASGTPLYSADVPAAEIYDPLTDTTYTNGFFLDAGGGNARMSVANSTDFDTSFTLEFFIKIPEQPNGYESFFRRWEVQDRRWMIDFDHGVNDTFGRIRSRWDTPAGVPDDMAQPGVDENVNFVVAPEGGGGVASKVFVDTGAKDEFGADSGPQNTGNPADYVYVAGSANASETDVALQGDGVNDSDAWHHVALTFDEESGEVTLYFNYALVQRRTLSDSEGDGYTHPAAELLFGKSSSAGYELLMDEVRFSNEVLDPRGFLRDAANVRNVTATTYWRMEDDGASGGGTITSVADSGSAGLPAAPKNGRPLYSTDVPGAMIFDPVTGATYGNAFSLDASGADARLGSVHDAALDTSFTLELFIKLVGEPSGYQSFVRRFEQSDLRWQMDFDHANKAAFGRPRVRFDTPAGGVPDGNVTNGVDENVNFVVGPLGGAGIPESQRLFIDTDSGDGLISSYDDPSDWALDGDGLNDIGDWRHFAVTFDEDLGTVSVYLDYELLQSRTLSDSEGNGYTHPAGGLDFGKFGAQSYGLLMDEVRYSNGVLFPDEFLQVATDEFEFKITDFSYDDVLHAFTLTWATEENVEYFVDRYNEEFDIWDEVVDQQYSSTGTKTYTDTDLPAGQTQAIYRVRYFSNE